MENSKSLSWIALILLVATVISFFSWSFDTLYSDVFTDLRYSPEASGKHGGFSSLNRIPCREARFVRDYLSDAIVRDNDIYFKANSMNVFLMSVLYVIGIFCCCTAYFSGIRKYRLLI